MKPGNLALLSLVLPLWTASAGFVQPNGWEFGTTMPEPQQKSEGSPDTFSVVVETKSEFFLFSRDRIKNVASNEDRNRAIKDVIDSILRKTQSSLLSNSSVMIAGNPAVRVRTMSVGPEERSADFILIFKEQEAYAFYYSTSDLALESPDAKRFFDDISNAK